MRNHLPVVSLVALLWLSSTAAADKAPLSDEALQNEAQVILVATIEKIRVETGASQFEGPSNWDWGIYLTLRVESVERGKVEEETLEASCFRIKSRRSVSEYLTPSGHHPIPEVGTRVKAYLEHRSSSWDVVLPNGLVSIPDGSQETGVRLPDARQVTELQSLTYTYLLPLEAWLLVLIVGASVLFCVRWIRKRQAHRGGVPS